MKKTDMDMVSGQGHITHTGQTENTASILS